MVIETDYDGIAADFSAYRARQDSTDWRLGYEPVLSALHPVAGKRILDFGCGSGDFGFLLAGRGASIINVDKSVEMVRLARRKVPDAPAFVRDARLDRLILDAVDVVTANFVFCSIFSDEEVRGIFVELSQVLRPGGTLVLLEPNQERSNGREFRSFVYLRTENPRPGDLVQVGLKGGAQDVLLTDVFRPRSVYRSLLTAAGFRVLDITEPTAPAEWGSEWDAERCHPPCVIYTAVKAG